MGSRKISVVRVLLSFICVVVVLGGCRKDTPPESKQTSPAPAEYAEAAPESAQEKAPASPESSNSPARDSDVQPAPDAKPKEKQGSKDAKASDPDSAKSSSDKKSSPKKKGAAGKIAENQHEKPGAAGSAPPVPRDPKIAFIEFTEPIAWPVSEAENGGEKLLYAFRLTDPSDKKKKATLTVAFMPDRKGKTTTVLKNWCKGYLLKGGGHPSVGELAKDEEINGLKVTLLEVEGTQQQTKEGDVAGQKLIAAVVQHPKGPFFIRAMGAVEMIDPQRDAILKFIRSVRKATPAPASNGELTPNAPVEKEESEAKPELKPPEADKQADAPQPPKPESADPPKQ